MVFVSPGNPRETNPGTRAGFNLPEPAGIMGTAWVAAGRFRGEGFPAGTNSGTNSGTRAGTNLWEPVGTDPREPLGPACVTMPKDFPLEAEITRRNTWGGSHQTSHGKPRDFIEGLRDFPLESEGSNGIPRVPRELSLFGFLGHAWQLRRYPMRSFGSPRGVHGGIPWNPLVPRGKSRGVPRDPAGSHGIPRTPTSRDTAGAHGRSRGIP